MAEPGTCDDRCTCTHHSRTCKPVSQTGLVYDERLTAHYCAWNEAYTECPERIQACYSRIQQHGLSDRCERIPVRPAKDEEALLCHSQTYLHMLEETKLMDTQELSRLSQSFDFVYFHNKAEENARLALGGAIDLVEKVVTGQLQNGMAVIRPPGHHAGRDKPNGYCYLNNVAVAAWVAVKKLGLKRVLIVDWDVHHGQGTQFHFYDDPRVLVFNIHRYEHGREWPHLRESDYDYIGEGKGRGYNFNVPLNETECSDSDYLSIFFNLLLPVAYEYQPELVLVSAGYDAAIGCPEGEMSLTPACFAHFVNLLRPLAAGKLVLILEGGYCMSTLAEGAALSLRALLGDPTPNIAPIKAAKQSVVESVLNAVKVQRGLHPSLAYQDTLTEEEEEERKDWWHMQYPPRPGMVLRTLHEYPQSFPLVQECCSPVSDTVRAMLDRQIRQLEEETILTVPQHRVGLLLYQLEGGVADPVSSAYYKLEEKGLLSQCHLLQDEVSSLGQALSTQFSVCSAAITGDKIQSCLMLPQHLGKWSSSIRWSQELSTAVGAIQRDFAKRVLIVNLFASQTILPITEDRPESSVLLVSLGEPYEGGEEGGGGEGRPPLLNIPVDRKQMGDGDFMAVCHQILLPVGYEFGPDLVILCFGVTTVAKEASGPSAASVGHVVTALQGLARGRMVVVAESLVGAGLDFVVESWTALLGGPHSVLQPCIPQPSTVDVIKKVQEQQSCVWKTLQFREKLPHPQPH